METKWNWEHWGKITVLNIGSSGWRRRWGRKEELYFPRCRNNSAWISAANLFCERTERSALYSATALCADQFPYLKSYIESFLCSETYIHFCIWHGAQWCGKQLTGLSFLRPFKGCHSHISRATAFAFLWLDPIIFSNSCNCFASTSGSGEETQGGMLTSCSHWRMN